MFKKKKNIIFGIYVKFPGRWVADVFMTVFCHGIQSCPNCTWNQNILMIWSVEVTPTNKQTKQTNKQTKQRNKQNKGTNKTKEQTTNKKKQTTNKKKQPPTTWIASEDFLLFLSCFSCPCSFPLAFFPYLTSAGSLSMAHPNPWKPGRVRDTRLQIWFIRAGWFAWRGRKLPVGWSAGFTMTANDCWKWRNATHLKLVSEFSVRQRHEKQVQWVTRIFWLVIGKVFEMYTM